VKLDDSDKLVTDGASLGSATFSGDMNITDPLILSCPNVSSSKVTDASSLNKLLKSTTFPGVLPDTAKMLHSCGMDFLYGLLFESSMRMPPLTSVGIPSVLYTDSSFFTVALNIPRESTRTRTSDAHAQATAIMNCLEPSMAYHEDKSCQVFVAGYGFLNDDAAAFLHKKNCTIWRSDDPSLLREAENEVGPASSSGNAIHYFRDVDTLSKARSVFIGYDEANPATEVILELIAYNRRMEVWRQGRDPPLLTNISICTIDY